MAGQLTNSSSLMASRAATQEAAMNGVLIASSVATTTAVTASNINTASVDLSSVYTAAAAPINSFISPGLRSSSQLKRAQERECIIPKRKVFIDVGTGKGSIVTRWFVNNYPTRNLKFEMYKIETTEVEVLEEMMRSKTIKWWISFAWDASQWVLGLRGRNMETDNYFKGELEKQDIFEICLSK
ncbi:hypothetical protein F2Q70_00000733 [Brassica cretica]|uniref:DUF7870 domain-containing protein n=1 Tax=Brassica cretica TaxID=69181 RepID=A0A8S9IQZ6_BRACR|nr:hypothetical protein F2Q70_00000733 [Brassica cretica]